MKIALASDLHYEFHDDDGAWLTSRLPTADVLVCAGDLSAAEGLRNALEKLCGRYAHVVFVPGNHEYYGSSLEDMRERMGAASRRHANLHVLDNAICEIQGHRFVGSTLWFPHVSGIEEHQNKLNDFRMIKHAALRLYQENELARAFLMKEVRSEDIVVTHHLPSLRSVPAQYTGDPLNMFFVCEMDSLIERVQPRLWMHGHTHSSCDYHIGQTRVVCNPFGYMGYETNSDFREVTLEM